MDVLIPAAKNTVSDMVQTGIDMLLFGERRSRGTSNRTKSFVSYGSYYSRGPGERERLPARSRYHQTTDDIVLESREEAEEVLEAMAELIDSYGSASVSDFLALVGEESEYTDDKYGWTNLVRARVDRVRGGYIIVLPKAGAI